MKKIVLLIVLSLAVISCSRVKKGEFLIEGEAKGIANGKLIILNKQDDSLGLIPVDTIKIKDGKFVFKGKTKEPAMHIIQIEGMNNQNSFVIVEEGEIKINIDKDSIQKTKVEGTYNNDEMQTFTNKRIVIQKKIKDFEYKNQSNLAIAQNKNDTVAIKKLQADYGVLQKEMKDYAMKYIETNPKSYISTLLIKSMFGDFEPDIKTIEKYYNNLDETLKSQSEGKKIARLIRDYKKVGVGKKAPEFSAKDPEGKVISLKESLGAVTIVDFWASWCEPCRKENPNLVALYNEFHAQGLNIIGVSLDDDMNDWKAAIANDKLTWAHVSNLKRWKEPIAKLYGVNATPKTFILNRFGVIIAMDLTGTALRDQVATMLTPPVQAQK